MTENSSEINQEDSDKSSDNKPNIRDEHATHEKDPFDSEQRFRSKSATELQRPRQKTHPNIKVTRPTPSLENILEHQQERDTRPQISVIPNYVADSLSESSDSIYKTPLTMGHSEKVTLTAYNPRSQLLTRKVPVKSHDDAASGRPMSLYSMSSASSLLQEGAQSQDYHASIQTVLSKLDECEAQTKKHMDDFTKNIVGKLDVLVAEIRDSRGRERKVSTDSRKSQERSGELAQTGGLQLPQSSSVSLQVILRLSERVPSKWKFLARNLGIKEHEIQQIKGNNEGDIQEQSYQMLLQWTQTQGRGSYQTLGEAVRVIFGEKLYSDFIKMVIDSEGRHSLIPNSQ